MSGAATIIITNIPPQRSHSPSAPSGLVDELLALANDNIAEIRSDDLGQIAELIQKPTVNWTAIDTAIGALDVPRPYVQQS